LRDCEVSAIRSLQGQISYILQGSDLGTLIPNLRWGKIMSQRTFQIYFYDSVTDHWISHETWLKTFCSSVFISDVST